MAGPFDAESRCTRTGATSQSSKVNPAREGSAATAAALNASQVAKSQENMRTVLDLIAQLGLVDSPQTFPARPQLGEPFRLHERLPMLTAVSILNRFVRRS